MNALVAPAAADPLAPFHPAVAGWFRRRFGAPTPPQALAWPRIRDGGHVLLAAPTGSGKTLAAFLIAIDRLIRVPTPAPSRPPRRRGAATAADPPPAVRVLYLSPLRALDHDVRRNLQDPLRGIAAEMGRPEGADPLFQIGLRTGDTPSAERARLLRHPPEVLITTPESLFLLLTSARAQAMLAGVETVIVDEIHALAGGKRGTHLALSLERLDALVRRRGGRSPQRVGLSATQRPMAAIAAFLGGRHPVALVDASQPRTLHLRVTVPVPDFRAVAADSIWDRIAPVVLADVRAHRCTLIFVPDRARAEALTRRLNALAGHEVCRAHHGSMAREARQEVEEALKGGRLAALCATGTLELGIDVGAVDFVVLVGSPGAAARGLQRLGRSGHAVGAASAGRLLCRTPLDLAEAAVLAREMLAGHIERTRVPRGALDVLAQHLVSLAAVGEWPARDLLALARGAFPYRDLGEADFDAVLAMLSGRLRPGAAHPPGDGAAVDPPPAHDGWAPWLRPVLTWDREAGVVRGRPGSARAALAGAGAIPDRGLFAVFGPDGQRVGELDEEFVHESRRGDVFLLGTTSWRIEAITPDRVLATPGSGPMPRVPFWHGEGPGRPPELGWALAAFFGEAECRRDDDAWWSERAREMRLDAEAAAALRRLVAEQAGCGCLPTAERVVAECYPDALGDLRLCVHAPFGRAVTTPWSLALLALLRREVGGCDAVATDNGMLFRLPRWTAEARAGGGEPVARADVPGDALSAGRAPRASGRPALAPLPAMTPKGAGPASRRLSLRLAPGRGGGRGDGGGRGVPRPRAGWRGSAAVVGRDGPRGLARRGPRALGARSEGRAAGGWRRRGGSEETGSQETGRRGPAPAAPAERGGEPRSDVALGPRPGTREASAGRPAAPAPGLIDAAERGRSGAAAPFRPRREGLEPPAGVGGVEGVAPDRARAAPLDLLTRWAPEALVAALDDDLAGTPLFAARFRECAARALLLERGSLRRRLPLWLQRLRAADLLAAARADPAFPLVREARRECLEDHFDLTAWRRVLAALADGRLGVVARRRPGPSPFAADMEFRFKASALYGGDAPRAETATAPGAADPLPAIYVQRAEAALARRLNRPPRSVDEWHDRLLRAGPIPEGDEPGNPLLAALLRAGRARAAAGRIVAAEEYGLWQAALRGDAAAREAFVVRWAATVPAVTPGAVRDRFGWDADLAALPLQALGDGRFAHPAVWREVRRHAVALARAEVVPVTRGALSAFAFRRQAAAAAGEALEALQGLYAPLAVWLEEILPPRVSGFRPEDLERLVARGAFLWVGRGREVAFYSREDYPRLAPPPPGAADPAAAVAVLLPPGTAAWFADLRERSGMEAAELAERLRAAAEAGAVSNDSLEPLARRAGPWQRALGGRWWALPPAAPSAEAWAEQLLRRYGVLGRQLWERVGPPAPWTAALGALRRAEGGGGVRSGYFVRGLGGVQFARARDLDALRADRPAAVAMVSALDPACLWEVVPRRSGTFVVALRGEPALLATGRGRRVRELRPLQGPELALVTRALRDVPTPRGRVEVAEWDGAPVWESPAALALEAAGFRRGPRTLSWHR